MIKIISLFYFVSLMSRSKIECVKENRDIYASIDHMRSLFITQAGVIKSLQDYVVKEKKRLDVVKRILKDIRQEHKRALADVNQYLDNLINAFRLIRRLKSDVEKYEVYMSANASEYRRNVSSFYYPDGGELLQAAYGLVRLQMVYKLQASDLANGVLKGTFSQNGRLFIERVSPMTSSDCFTLGHVSFEDIGVRIDESPHIDIKRKLRWMLEAYKKFQQENCTICSVEEVAIMDRISKKYKELGDLKNSILWIEKRTAARPDDPINKQFAELVKEMQKTLNTARFPENKPQDKKVLQNTKGISNREPPQRSICYTKSEVSSKIAQSLTCYFAHGPHPFLRLARIKAEKMYISPDITLYYDVLSETRIKILKQGAQMLNMALVVEDSKKPIFSNNRIAKLMTCNYAAENSWLVKQIMQITNVNMPLDALIQVLNYGIGGHYSSHPDFFGEKVVKNYEGEFRKSGDRQATIVYYMSDVEQGGATAFEKLGVVVYPVKGAALVWDNLYPSGDGNRDSIHESCPVLRGSKWIAVKWIREVHQTHCPIWRTEDGIMTQEKYLKSGIRQPFRDKRFEKIAS